VPLRPRPPRPTHVPYPTLFRSRGKIMAAAAEEMPPEKFGFKPTPAQMSFGELTLHIAKSNNFLCSGISGTPEPADLKLTEKDPRSEEHTSELQSPDHLVCRLLL